jgi:hypothetical protein
MKPTSGGNYGHPGNEGSASERVHPELHDKVSHDAIPYWKRAHRDWVFWVGLFLMLSAAIVYVLSDNLSLLPRGQPRVTLPGTIGK